MPVFHSPVRQLASNHALVKSTVYRQPHCRCRPWFRYLFRFTDVEFGSYTNCECNVIEALNRQLSATVLPARAWVRRARDATMRWLDPQVFDWGQRTVEDYLEHLAARDPQRSKIYQSELLQLQASRRRLKVG